MGRIILWTFIGTLAWTFLLFGFAQAIDTPRDMVDNTRDDTRDNKL